MKKTLTLSLSFLTLAFTSLNAQNLHMVNGNASDFGFSYDTNTGIVSNLFFTFGESEGIAVNDDFTISWGIQSDMNDFGTYTEIDRQVFTSGINGFSSFEINNWSSINLNDDLGINDGDYFLVGIIDAEDDISETNETQADNGMLLASNATETISFTRAGSLSAADVSVNGQSANTFPNPFQNKLTVDVNTGQSTLLEVKLLDITSKVVLQNAVTVNMNGNQLVQLNTSELNVGMYVLQIKTSEGTTTKKVIKK